ncbi:MAG: alpha-amylase family glycosyl hydrolase [Brevinematia bacterium]
MKKFLLIFVSCIFVFPSYGQWYREVSFYQIFPRSFYDSDGDGIGDIKGIISKLDYVKSLGVGGIWLNPTFPSPSYHGYDITDYYNVNPQFGTLDDLKLLVKEAEKRNIKILLDLVINHTSSQIGWFKKSQLRDPFFDSWYIWVPKIPNVEGKIGWSKPWTKGNSPWEVWSYSGIRREYYYSAFSPGMPDLNLKNPDVVNEIYKIAKYWLEMGIGGFRLDAVRYLIEIGPGEGQADTEDTIMFLKSFNSFCKKVNPQSFLVGEVWTDNKTVLKYKDALDGCFDFETREVVSSTVGFNPRIGRFYKYLEEMLALTGSLQSWKFLYPFSSNHDVTRVHNLIFKRPDNFERLKLFYTVLFTLPGNPFIYYGDEIGMINSPYLRGDMAFRDPMVWENSEKVGFTTGSPWTYVNPDPIINVKDQEKDKDSILNHVRKISKIRNENKVFVNGNFSILSNDFMDKVVSYARYDSSTSNFALVIVYSYPSEIDFKLFLNDDILSIISNKKIVDLFTGNVITITNGELNFSFRGYTNLIFTNKDR